MRIRAILAAAIAAWALPALAEPPAGPPASQSVDLKFVTIDAAMMTTAQVLDQQGRLNLPFANTRGKLLLVCRDGNVQADTNGDGTVNEKDQPAVTAKGGTIRIPMRFGAEQMDYPLRIAQVQPAGSVQLIYLSPGGWLEGKTDTVQFRIMDSNCNGKFGEATDQIAVSTAGGGARFMPWSNVVGVNGKLYRADLIQAKLQLKLTEHTGPTATVSLKTDARDAVAMLQHTGGQQTVQLSAAEPGTLIPGLYKVGSIMLSETSGGQTSALLGRAAPKGAPIRVAAGENVITVGAPFKMVMTAGRQGDVIDLANVEILGAAGEEYRPNAGKGTPHEFAAYLRSRGQEQKVADLGYA